MSDQLYNLVIVAGPTAVGKTALGIRLAQELGTEIISCDSRQFYREMNIGTAKPTPKELAMVNHHFIGHLSVSDYYNVARFENDVLALLAELFKKYRTVLMVGGSGLYIDAVCNGIDDFPDPDPDLRSYLKSLLQNLGIDKLRTMLQKLDPEYYGQVDLSNPGRLLRALEVCIATGQKYSDLRVAAKKNRNFNVIKIALSLPREELFDRIEKRTDAMIKTGLVEEAYNLLLYRQLNALNTVGYKEMFSYFDNQISLDQAVTDIKTNTRRYAKRQLTWLKRTRDYAWFAPDQAVEIMDYISQYTG